jgi:hypothetical protein
MVYSLWFMARGLDGRGQRGFAFGPVADRNRTEWRFVKDVWTDTVFVPEGLLIVGRNSLPV